MSDPDIYILLHFCASRLTYGVKEVHTAPAFLARHNATVDPCTSIALREGKRAVCALPKLFFIFFKIQTHPRFSKLTVPIVQSFQPHCSPSFPHDAFLV